jgi:hypothetical protein
MPITPPIFVQSDDLHAFNSVAEAEAYLEPADVRPDDRAYDSQGRLLRVKVRGEGRSGAVAVEEGDARVVLERVEEGPGHAGELRTLLVGWLARVEPAPELAGASLPDLVERAWRRTARQTQASSRQLTWALTGGLALLLVVWVWWLTLR